MNIEQRTFEQIVGDMARLLDAKHTHVRTVTGNGGAVPFRIGLAVVADAVLQSLELNGMTVGAESEGERAVSFLEQNALRLGVNVECDGHTVHLKRMQ